MRSKSALFSFLLCLTLLTSCGLVNKGAHNAGKDCMWPGCHGYEGPAWTYAGTVFISDEGSSPARGVTVTIRDSTGEYRLKTNSAGNFYTSKGDPADGYEASIDLGRDIRTMNLGSTEGACNRCHARGGSTEPLHTD